MVADWIDINSVNPPEHHEIIPASGKSLGFGDCITQLSLRMPVLAEMRDVGLRLERSCSKGLWRAREVFEPVKVSREHSGRKNSRNRFGGAVL